MKVKWTEYADESTLEIARSWCPNEDHSELDQEIQGEVIATTRGLFGDTYFTVKCDDGRIRDVNTNDVQIV